MKDKHEIARLKEIIELIDEVVDSEKFTKAHPLEHKDLKQALMLLKSVRRRVKSKEKPE